jgi:hypothetical protein
LRDTKELDQNWITNYQADYQLLSELFKQYGLCEECRQPNTGDQWCQACNKKNFTTRILSLKQSGNTQIDNFIQELQLAATEANKFLE